jgi:hypothetical protein
MHASRQTAALPDIRLPSLAKWWRACAIKSVDRFFRGQLKLMS